MRHLAFVAGVGKLKPGSAWSFIVLLKWVTAERQTINPESHSFTSKCFGPRTALLLGAGVWHFSALSLWGCNINKASLKVYQLLKLSRSLPITVTKQSVQHKNMFPRCNSQQIWQMGGLSWWAQYFEMHLTKHFDGQVLQWIQSQWGFRGWESKEKVIKISRKKTLAVNLKGKCNIKKMFILWS